MSDINIEREFLDDKELLKVCSANPRIWNEVCDDEFLMRRLTSKYPGIEQYKGNFESWKRFFLRAIYYIARLREKFGEIYDSEKGDPKKYYYWKYWHTPNYEKYPPDTVGIIRNY